MSHHASDDIAAAARRRQLLSLTAVIGVVLIVLVTIAMYSMYRLDRIVTENGLKVDALTTLSDRTRVAQVSFKTQVQEWKNTLLRGYEAKDFEAYHGAFLKQRDEVRSQLSELAVDAKALDFSAIDLEALKSAHERLDEAYDQALAGFLPNDPLSVRTVDSKMRGLDRPINDEFDVLVAAVKSFTDERRQLLRVEIEQAIASMRSTLYISLAVGLIVLFITALVGMRAIRNP